MKIWFLNLKITIFRVIELVRDFKLKKLVVMKTIFIKSMLPENVKVKNVHYYIVHKFSLLIVICIYILRKLLKKQIFLKC